MKPEAQDIFYRVELYKNNKIKAETLLEYIEVTLQLVAVQAQRQLLQESLEGDK